MKKLAIAKYRASAESGRYQRPLLLLVFVVGLASATILILVTLENSADKNRQFGTELITSSRDSSGATSRTYESEIGLALDSKYKQDSEDKVLRQDVSNETARKTPHQLERDRLSRKFDAKYSNLSKGEIERSYSDLRAVFESLRELALSDRRARGNYIETIRTSSQAQKQPEIIPKDAIVRIVTNPVEKLEEAKATKQISNWYIYLTREEYPEVFEIRDEIAYLRAILASPPVEKK
ncbi:MAG: hypothetical protein ACKVS6_03040 [Planctomycetota bacterium]